MQHIATALWVTASQTNQRRSQLVHLLTPGKPTDELLLAANTKTHSDPYFLFSCGFKLLIKWSHYQKWTILFLHRHRTSFQVKPLNLIYRAWNGQFSQFKNNLCVFVFPDESQDSRIYHINSPFSPPPPPPSFSFSPEAGCSTQTHPPLTGTCSLTSASILNM